MKTIYFVRHGESEANVGHFHGQPTTSLTELGRSQAQFIAERCSKLPLQVLITSTYTRAKDTAGYIATKTGLSPIESDLFVENAFVSTLWDKPRTDPASQDAVSSIMEHWGTPGFHVGDEENFEEIIARVDQALGFLAERTEDQLCVVSHGGFLRNVVGRAMFGSHYTPAVSQVFFYALHVIENTALTVLTFDQTDTAHPWRLKIWNDHAHLAD